MKATVESCGLGSNSRFMWIEEFCLLEHTLTYLDLLRLTWQPWPPSDQYTCFRNKECSGSLKLSWIDLNDLSDKAKNLDSLEMIWPDSSSWNWLTLTHTKRVEFQADSKQSPNDFTVAPINARKSYWAPVIQRRFTSIWVSPTEIKVSPSLYKRVRIELPKFKRGWVGPSVKVIPSEYNAVPPHSESVQMRASHQHKDIWVITSELQGFDRSS